MTEEEKDNDFVENMKNDAEAKFGTGPHPMWKFTPDENKVLNSLREENIKYVEEFDELNELLLPGGLFIKPCTKCEGNNEFQHLKAKAEFKVWRYLRVPGGDKHEWTLDSLGSHIFLKHDGQWMWGSQSFDGKKYKVPRGMKCKRKGMLQGSNCAEGYTCDKKELKCVKKKKRKSLLSRLRVKNAGRSRKKKRRKSTKKKRKRKRKRTKKKRRRRRR